MNQNLIEKNNILIQIHIFIKIINNNNNNNNHHNNYNHHHNNDPQTPKIGSRQHMRNRAKFRPPKIFARGLPPLLIPPTHPPTPAPSHSRSAAAQQGLPPAPPLPPPAHCSSSGGRGPRLRLARPTSYLGYD